MSTAEFVVQGDSACRVSPTVTRLLLSLYSDAIAPAAVEGEVTLRLHPAAD